jgi:molybdopterin synthase sulfur carrier subunit
MIKVKCFGIAREIVKDELLEMEGSNLLVSDLRQRLLSDYPEFSSIKGFMIAVNQEYATDDMVVKSTDEIAIIPPVSGG